MSRSHQKAQLVKDPNFRQTSTGGSAFNVCDVKLGKDLPKVDPANYNLMWNSVKIKEDASNKQTDSLFEDYNQIDSKKPENHQRIISAEPFSTFSNEKTSVVKLWQMPRRCKSNILADAAMTAYGQHYPLKLSPDVFWITIMKTVAGEINDHAEDFRSILVAHEGKKELTVDCGRTFPATPEGWKALLPEFARKISENIKDPEVSNLMECNFSTTSTVEATVSTITLMDAMQSYFSFGCMLGCGIPYIELAGSVQDWEKLADKALKILTMFKMDWWYKDLQPILEQFVKAAKGDIDLQFWAEIAQKHETNMSGETDKMEGWLCKFFPINKKVRSTIEIKDIPTHISMAPLSLKNESGDKVLDTVLTGGINVLVQHKDTKMLEPKASWALLAKGDIPEQYI